MALTNEGFGRWSLFIKDKASTHGLDMAARRRPDTGPKHAFTWLFDPFWLAAQADGTPGIPHQSQLKVRLEANDGSWHDRVPAWTKLAWQALCQPF